MLNHPQRSSLKNISSILLFRQYFILQQKWKFDQSGNYPGTGKGNSCWTHTLSPHKKSSVTENSNPMRNYEVGEIDHGNVLIFPINAPSRLKVALLQRNPPLPFSQTPTEGSILALTCQYLHPGGGYAQ